MSYRDLARETHRETGVAISSGWQAELRLAFAKDAERSYLASRWHCGPLRVQRPFYPEGAHGPCHVYLLHPPGGVVGGDELTIQIDIGAQAHALLTTPAAAKFYRSDGRLAAQRQHLRVAQQATLEWFPQENIVFHGAQARSITHISLAEEANFIGWDITCLGRPGSAEPFRDGAYRACLEIWRLGKPLFIERALMQGKDGFLAARWGMAGCSVSATLLCTGGDPSLVDEVRAAVVDVAPLLADDGMFSATQMQDVLVCRYLGHHAEDAKAYFSRALSVIRPRLLGREFSRPRIWDT